MIQIWINPGQGSRILPLHQWRCPGLQLLMTCHQVPPGLLAHSADHYCSLARAEKQDRGCTPSADQLLRLWAKHSTTLVLFFPILCLDGKLFRVINTRTAHVRDRAPVLTRAVQHCWITNNVVCLLQSNFSAQSPVPSCSDQYGSLNTDPFSLKKPQQGWSHTKVGTAQTAIPAASRWHPVPEGTSLLTDEPEPCLSQQKGAELWSISLSS